MRAARQSSAAAAGHPGAAGGERRERLVRLVRYAAGSGIATVCSQVAFVVLYGPLHASPAAASALAWLAGAVPNYWLNRSWTWRRRGRPSLVREVLPYAVIVALTLLVAVAATSAVDALASSAALSPRARVAAVTGTYLAVYVLTFLLRYFLFDRLFRGSARRRAAGGDRRAP